jgi:hypothetical protein
MPQLKVLLLSPTTPYVEKSTKISPLPFLFNYKYFFEHASL